MRALYFRILKVLLLSVLFISTSFLSNKSLNKPNHNFYLSICEIVCNEKNQSLEITFRFFTDDLEKAVNNYNNANIFTDTGNKKEGADKNLFNYLKKHFALYNEKNKIIGYDFIGWETNKEHIWCYLEANSLDICRLKVKNNILTELFIEQKNLVFLKSGNKESSILLDKKQQIGILTFD